MYVFSVGVCNALISDYFAFICSSIAALAESAFFVDFLLRLHNIFEIQSHITSLLFVFITFVHIMRLAYHLPQLSVNNE